MRIGCPVGWLLGALLTGAAMARAADVKVAEYGGAPLLAVNGAPRYPLFHFSQEILDDYARRFDEAGFLFYACIEENYFLDLGWKGDGEYDFAMHDKVIGDFKRRLPNAYLLPKIHCWAPEWWVEKYPEERTVLLKPVPPGRDKYQFGAGPRHDSFASVRWQAGAEEGLRRLVRHLRAAPYADRVMGIMIAGGEGGEWHPFGSEFVPDASEPMRRQFVRWLRREYGGDPARLRAAWGRDDADFDTAPIPGLAERTTPAFGLFRDPKAGRPVIDYYRAFHQNTVDFLARFARIVKEESGGEYLTCVNYSYQPDMPYMPQEVHHRAAAAGLRLADMDMYSSPHAYWRRDLGQHGQIRHYPQSLIARGKLFIDEADERTHLHAPGLLFRHAGNLWESRQVLRRSLANAVGSGAGLWFMDHTSRAWYADEAFWPDFRRFREIGDRSLELPRGSAADVALLAALESEFYVASPGDLTAQFVVAGLEEFARAGVAFDRFLVEDLDDGLVPDRRVVALWDGFRLTPAQAEALRARRNGGRTFLWHFAPGYAADGGLSVAAMNELTGMTFAVRDDPYDFVVPDPERFPGMEPYRLWREGFGSTTRLSPRFVPTDGDLEVWARHADTGEPAIAVKRLDGWTSVYSAVGPLPWPMLGRVAEEAGAHRYLDGGDNVIANAGWVGVHAAAAGEKRLRLPPGKQAVEVFSGRRLGRPADGVLAFPMQRGETLLFALEPAAP